MSNLRNSRIYFNANKWHNSLRKVRISKFSYINFLSSVLCQLASILFTITSFYYISYKAMRSRNRNSSSRQSSGTEENTSNVSLSDINAQEEVKPNKQFSKHKKISKLMLDPSFCSAVNDYLIHYQYNILSNSLLLWNNLIKIKEISVRIISSLLSKISFDLNFST